jgi:hypothetical protein
VRESLILKREIGERGDIGQALCRSAFALSAVGNARAAATLLACFDALTDDVGSGEVWVQRMNDETRALVAATLDEAAFAAAREEGRRLSLDDGLALALAALA